ncbi:MAG: type II toxin-antitoxin system RelE/ParE family toxin [Planctomycetes bacterium]|jgi:mRNA-degrading endonuclease RelE of RelBE toxin-antitoxin system|nr:type II toxin-antitoxin system RelE/ParE family toxin [Planctomycetota bacterium]
MMIVFTFIETTQFTRLVKEYLSDDELRELQATLIESPESGDVIPGSGGVRKLRWRAAGRGKRGGYRVIYFVRLASDEVWLITIYPKNIADKIPADVLKKIRREIEHG